MNKKRKIDLVITECRNCPYKCSKADLPGRYCSHEDDRELWWLGDDDEYILEEEIRIPGWCPLEKG